MKFRDLTTKTDKELQELVISTKKQHAQLAIDMRTKQVTGVKQVAALKKTIARTLTLLRERELAKMEQQS